MTVKAFLAALAALALMAGFALPVGGDDHAQAQSQFATLQLD